MIADSVVIRLAPTMRKVLLGWFTALSLFATAIAVAAVTHGSIAAALVAVSVSGVLLTVGWRWSSLAVMAERDQLVVRQFLRTRTAQRTEIAFFSLGGRRGEAPGVAATGFNFRSEQEIETYCAVLEEWRRATSLSRLRRTARRH